MYILTLLKANLRNKKGGFISVIVLVFIISLIVISVVNASNNLKDSIDQSMDDINASDMVSIIRDFKCDDKMIGKIEADENVEKVSILPTIRVTTKINGIDFAANSFMAAYSDDLPDYKLYAENQMSFIDKKDNLNKGEIYMPIATSVMCKCKIGDMVNISYGDKEEKFTIKGFIEEPYMGSSTMGSKLSFINKDDFGRLYSERITDDTAQSTDLTGWKFVNVYQKDSRNLTNSELKKEINEASSLVDAAFYTFTREASINYTLLINNIINIVMYAFCILLFAIVLVVMGHSISSSIDMEYVNLGVLKAQGFTKGNLRKVLLFQYVLAEIIGIILGSAASIFAINKLNIIYRDMTGILGNARINIGFDILFMVVMIVVGGLYLYIKTRKLARISPVRAISGGKAEVYFSNGASNTLAKKGLNIRLALRQLLTAKKQYISALITVSFLVFFMILVATLNNLVNSKNIEDLYGILGGDIEVSVNDLDDKEDVINDINKESKITSSCEMKGNYLSLDGNEYYCLFLEKPEKISSILEGRSPKYDNEIMITEFVSDDIGKGIGDTVKVTFDEYSKDMVITGIYQTTAEAGMASLVPSVAAKSFINDFTMKTSYIDIEDEDKTADIVKKLQDKYGDKIYIANLNEENNVSETIDNAITVINIVIYVISIIFSCIVIKLVCSNMFLREKNDYGIMKAMGFTSRQIRLQFAFRFMFVAVIGKRQFKCA